MYLILTGAISVIQLIVEGALDLDRPASPNRFARLLPWRRSNLAVKLVITASAVSATIDYPGVPVDHSTVVENHGVLKNVKIAVRPHFGLIVVAPQQNGLIDSIPPSTFGDNLDNWRVAQGASVYLPVDVAGALLSIGDPHASQGDSELCGTAIECSLTGEFKLVLHKKATLADQPYADLTYPLVETADEWVLHGLSHPNYLAEFGTHA